ncbi:hypothetical protein Ciccas_012222 [Cichlidogyrus casuarinus]|uniref:Uncharacterized protein n=1 Tax=Cichlidogyrus casuarinus TaxID=1844966 RepID=A0ABD2PTZ5_9PLAT
MALEVESIGFVAGGVAPRKWNFCRLSTELHSLVRGLNTCTDLWKFEPPATKIISLNTAALASDPRSFIGASSCQHPSSTLYFSHLSVQCNPDRLPPKTNIAFCQQTNAKCDLCSAIRFSQKMIASHFILPDFDAIPGCLLSSLIY